MTTNRHWTNLCKLLGLADLSSDPALNTNAKRSLNRPVFIHRIAEAVRQYELAEMMRRLREADVPYAPVNAPADLVSEPHLNEGRHLLSVKLSDGRTFKLPTLPVSFAGAEYTVRLPPPALGEHTNAVLSELGYVPAEIEALQSTSAVLQSDRMLGIDSLD